VLISCFMSFAERFWNCRLNFNAMQKWIMDLESARKIGLDTVFKIFKISKMFFTCIIRALSELIHSE
jgi:hypothetical protein